MIAPRFAEPEAFAPAHCPCCDREVSHVEAEGVCVDCLDDRDLAARIAEGADARTVSLARRLAQHRADPVPACLAALALGAALAFCGVYAERCDADRDACIAAMDAAGPDALALEVAL